MKFEKLKELKTGYNVFTEANGKHSNMMMDTGILKLNAGMKETIVDVTKESAYLLLDGNVQIEWENEKCDMKRKSLFDENPWCLHVAKGVKVKITAATDAEILRLQAVNEKSFNSKLYTPEDCRSDIFGEGVWNDCARRVVRTIFDYSNAPYSNIVMGEVINYPGKWSSYIPHHHPQPEIYYYRFNKPQGFGCSIIGEDVYKITDNSISAISGGLVHPQTTAPGYAMYYCWMIRHLENNPWVSRIDEDEHKWLLEPGIKIWPDKE